MNNTAFRYFQRPLKLSTFAAMVAIFVLVGGCSKSNTISGGKPTCKGLELSCDEVQLRRCLADGTGFEPLDTCVTSQLCSLSLEATRLTCIEPVCQPDELHCDGASMKTCATGQDTFEEIHLCPTAEACERGLASKACRECTFDTDCNGNTTECQWPVCKNLVCAVAFAEEGTKLAAQTEHDCQARVCDGAGGEREQPDDADLPKSDTSCDIAACNNGSLTVTHADEGQPCENGGHCDGQGTCSSCTPGQVGSCFDSSTQTRCNSLGTWENVPCGDIKERCYEEDGQCYGGALLVWGAGGDGSTFGIDSTEVTRSQYEKWLNSGPSLDESPECAWNTSYLPSEGWPPGSNPLLPVVGVDWCDAKAYCQGVGKRLCGRIGGGPSDFWSPDDAASSQWYRVCSSAGTLNYPYGGASQGGATNGYNASLCNGDNLHDGSVEAGQSPGCVVNDPPFEGVVDLSGNVAEWEDACNDAQSIPCLVRGGYFAQSSVRLTCADQAFRDRNYQGIDVGIRCCTP